MSNDRETRTCAGCGQAYEIENTDAPTFPMSYCSAECEADAEDGPEGGTDDAEGDCPGCWVGNLDGDSLVERIGNAINTDDESPERNSERIIDRYQAATDAEKAVVDDIFASLCGWTLKTLIAGKENQ